MPGRTQRWEHFPHGADAGIRGIGPTAQSAFVQAAHALIAVVTDNAPARPTTCIAIECSADDLDGLFFDWIDALVYEMATRRLVFGRFEVTIDDARLRATAWGDPIDPALHVPAVEVKGPTYTELCVSPRLTGGWQAQCVVDV